jgi:hypothetical protein
VGAPLIAQHLARWVGPRNANLIEYYDASTRPAKFGNHHPNIVVLCLNMARTTIVHPPDPTLPAALRLATVFAGLTFALHLFTILWQRHLGYGYFRDEFYYIACGRHLAWGYVDHGPMVAVQARIATTLFGRSLLGIRMFSILAECAATFLTGIAAWALGGRRPAQSLAMTAVLVTPINIAMGDFLSMNSFEPMFWTTCVIALVLLLTGKCSARACWITFGAAAGLGLLNKPSMTFFLLAIGVGLLLTPQRRILFTRDAAIGIALLILIALPNVLWQIHNHWPTLEFLHNGRVNHKNSELPPLKFFLAQLLMAQPINAFLWITGVVALLRARSLPTSRWLGFTYLIFFAIMCTLHAKDYYLAGIYPSIIAAGAIAWERKFAASRAIQRNSAYSFPIYQTLLLVTGALILPMAAPVLKPAPWIAYTKAIHLFRPSDETEATSDLPQFFADRFGWQEMTDTVVNTYRSLSPADQAQVCIAADNYGEAGAIDFLGKHAEPSLPPAISHQNNYWIWGYHGCTARVVIDITDASAADLRNYYDSVEIVGTVNVQHSMPEENKNIYLLRGRKLDHPITWEKHYI